MNAAALRPPILHVGLGHSGTKSLQRNIFSTRPDLFYAGIPFGELGGIFSSIKYLEPEQYDRIATARLCKELIFNKMRSHQRLVISDENLVDQPAIYYTPSMMPVRMIAERLRNLFGPCTVLFSLRNQYRYVISNYLVLKSNSIALANRTIEPFDAWFSGNQTQIRNLFLRNLDPSHVIKVYQSVFGAEAVHVLPLELLVEQGAETYLNRLCQMTGLEFSPADAQNYLAHNASPQNNLVLNEEQRAIIRELSSAGNAFVARQFGLPLRDLGYPMPASDTVRVLLSKLARSSAP